MKDHRINRKKRHPLENIIAITIVAVICNMETWEDLTFFGEMKRGFFSKFLDLKNGIPSKDTFRRFFAALDPNIFESHFTQWAKSLVKDIDKEIVSIDGKTIRQASRMREDNPIHLVSAWASANELVLGQLKTDDKSNEITAIPSLLEALFLEGATITIDAMGCQKSIVNQIVVDKKADYVLALKENHPTLGSRK
jgi:predicted transposase YbfD/YdcC